MRAERPFLPLLRDAVLVAGVAVLTVQALRRWAGDRYMVPSDSMEPVLHGDPVHGDVVFVDKLAIAARRRRHDLVVVRHPEHAGQQLVKRIAARGDDHDACCIDLIGGDVWLGPDRQRLRREVKDPGDARTMRVPWAAWPADHGAFAVPLDLRAAGERDGELVLPPLSADAASPPALLSAEARARRRNDRTPGALPTGFVGTARPVDASFVDATGVRGRAGEDVGVVDCGMDLELAAPVDALLGTVELRDQALTFVWRAARGAFELWSDGVVVHEGTLPVRPTGAHRVEFGLLDDRAFLIVDGRRDATVAFARQPDWPSSAAGARPGEPRTHVHVVATGEAPLRLRRLTVFRDVYLTRERIAAFPGDRGDWPRCLPSGTWFLLGDNTFDSRDSRQFDAVPATSFLGVPRAVLGPWSRLRWLRP